MAAAVAGYSHDHFHSLPDLNSARDNFLQLNGPKLVEDVFKDFFIANDMDRTFGLAMPHRHFDILPGQKIVNYNGTSTAWNASPGEGWMNLSQQFGAFPPVVNWCHTSSDIPKGTNLRWEKRNVRLWPSSNACLMKRMPRGFLACASTREMTLRAHVRSPCSQPTST